MKTTDNGSSFDPVFEKEAVASIGAVAVSASDPKVVWVGTGEANDRNSSGWGDGVYRSTDARRAPGRTSGLKESKTIARIVVHPTDPETAWVAVTGDLWTPSASAGSTRRPTAAQDLEGGARGARRPTATASAAATSRSTRRTRTRSTRRSTRAGARRGPSPPARTPPTARTSAASSRAPTAAPPGASSTKGLPGAHGPHRPLRVREGPEDRLRDRPERRGRHQRTSTTCGASRAASSAPTTAARPGRARARSNPRPFYFSQIRVDPANDKRVYVLGFMLHVSEDGGKTFREDRFKKRPPRQPRARHRSAEPEARCSSAPTAGRTRASTAAKAWEHLRRASPPASTTGSTSTRARRTASAAACRTTRTGSGRAGRARRTASVNARLDQHRRRRRLLLRLRPGRPERRLRRVAGGRHPPHQPAQRRRRRTCGPRRPRAQPAFRFHWNSPLIGSRHEKGTLYLGGNRVFKLTRPGRALAARSAPTSRRRTRRGPRPSAAAPRTTASSTRSPSRRSKAGLLWAGTDDGKLWMTEDDGDALDRPDRERCPRPAKGQWISRIEAGARSTRRSPTSRWTRIATGKFAPLALSHRRRREGRWQSIAGEPAGRRARSRWSARIPKNPNLLFAGTEFGLFVELRPRRALDGDSAACPRWRWTTSWCTRASAISSSPRTAAASSSWTTSGRSRS